MSFGPECDTGVFLFSFFKKIGPTPAFFRLFSVFSNKLHYNFYNRSMWKMSCPSWIQRWDSNPQPSEREPPPISTRPVWLELRGYDFSLFLRQATDILQLINFFCLSPETDKVGIWRLVRLIWSAGRDRIGSMDPRIETGLISDFRRNARPSAPRLLPLWVG